MRTLLLTLPLLAACGEGTWIATTWGEDYIEQGIPASEFADGCWVEFSAFEVQITEAALLDGDGEVVGDAGVGRFELTEPGPQELGRADVAAKTYATARFRIAPTDGPSVRAAGTLSCGEDQAVGFDWAFSTDTTYVCEPTDLTLAAGGEGTTELTVHGDHLFYDGLEDPDASVRGQAILDADGDADGEVTLQELGSVSVAGLGYTVGSASEVEDLAAFVEHLTTTVGHVDGEGHCQ